MASVYNRNDFYYAKFVDHNGRRTSRNTGVTSKREAHRIASGFEAEALELRRKAKDKPSEFAHILEIAVRVTIRIPKTPPVIAWIEGKKGSFFPKLSQRTTATHSTTFANLMKNAGVDRNVTLPGGIEARRSFHSLRHSLASWLAEADVHSDIRRKLTGHKSEGVHAIYTHHDASLKRAIAELPYLSAGSGDST